MERLRRLAVVVLLSSIVSAAALPLFAQGGDGRTDYLARLLRTSPAFRVRAQACLSLGAVTPATPAVMNALEDGLRDTDPSVRAACVQGLQRTGQASALTALRPLARDPDPDVRTAAGAAIRELERLAASTGTSGRPSGSGTSAGGASAGGGGEGATGTPRYYVAVGVPGTKVAGISPERLAAGRAAVIARLRTMEGVVIAPDGETPAQAQRVIRERGLTGFYLDLSLTSLGPDPRGLRAAVSVIVQTYPDRNVRSMLGGAATVPGGSGPAAEQDALVGAFQGSVSRLPTAMAAGAPR